MTVKVITSVRNQALNLCTKSEKQEHKSNQQLIENMIGMDEAQKIAEEFILTHKRDYTKIDISSTEPNSDGWIVKGTISRPINGQNIWSQNWTIIIKGQDVHSFDFKPNPPLPKVVSAK